MLKTVCSFIKRVPFKQIKNMQVFIQNVNPITGQNDWVLQNESYDYHQEVARSSFADMLHDSERNKKYEAGLKVAIDFMHSNGKKANVLDIGTGIGLLSMMAVRNGADSVVACEAFKPMSECAVKIIQQNGFADKIKVIPKRSTELTVGSNCDLQFRANILVTEVFDTELIGEGALGIFKHAQEELLEENSVCVPNSATVYAQIISSSLVSAWNKITPIFDKESREILLNIPKEVADCPGSSAVHDIQLSQLDISQVKTLVLPQPVFHFQWLNHNLVYERTAMYTLEAQENGVPIGLFMWWDLQMDIDNKILLSCAPYWAHPDAEEKVHEIPWRDHWLQAVYYFPTYFPVQKNQEICLIASHDEYSFWFNIERDSNITDDYVSQKSVCTCGAHLAYSRTRFGQINDIERRKTFLNLLKNNVDSKTVMLVLGNGFYNCLAAKKFGPKRIIFVDNNTASKKFLKSIAEHNNVKNVEFYNDFNNIPKLDEVTLVLGEPYFTSSILPWDNLLFVYLLKDIKNKLNANVKIFPKRMSIKCLPVKFKDLQKIRTPLGNVEDFNMEHFDKLIWVNYNKIVGTNSLNYFIILDFKQS